MAVTKMSGVCDFRFKQYGAAMYEYLIGITFVLAALFLPVLPSAGGDGRTSAGVMLIQAFRDSYASYFWGMSIPI